MNGQVRLACALLLLAGAAAADEPSMEPEVEMFFTSEETVTSAALHAQEIGMSPSAITVITREDIQASGATTIPDLLRMVPGMDVVITNPFLGGITARLPWGNENNQFLVLVDGREINMELLGMVLFELEPVCLADIERIEIIRGPGSALYGANAVAGVVNITTQPIPQKTSGWIRLDGGEVGRTAVLARVATRLGQWGFAASGGADEMGTFADPRLLARRIGRLRALAEYRLSDSQRLLVDGGISQAEGIVAAAVGSLEGSLSLQTLGLSYESEDLQGHIYWSHAPVSARMDAPLEFSGARLAQFVPFEVDTHTVNGEIQWTLPRFFEPLLMITGGGARLAYLSSDQLLDADTFADRSSSRYHQAGMDHLEARAGAYLHGELAPADWLTVTGGMRFDYNTETGVFLSPRLSAVVRPSEAQYLRMSAARAFRKPAFIETRAHLMVEFPDDSPITGDGQDKFQEFMIRVLGNSSLQNEQLLSCEVGYLGRFLNGRLSLSVDLYYNYYAKEVVFLSDIVPDEQGLPDLESSSFMHFNRPHAVDIIGSEWSVRLQPTDGISLLASWTYREVIDHDSRESSDQSPKHLIALGGRFRTAWGLIGSLYVFTRSEFVDYAVENPAGIMEPLLSERLPNLLLLLGKMGWKQEFHPGLELEAGVMLLLPVSPFFRPHFRFREDGGGIDLSGQNYGGDLLRRMLTGYVQGTF